MDKLKISLPLILETLINSPICRNLFVLTCYNHYFISVFVSQLRLNKLKSYHLNQSLSKKPTIIRKNFDIG